MALFLLEDRDFKAFWMKIKVMLNQIFSNFNTICIHTFQPLKPSMREISPSAMTAEGEILCKRHVQPKYMTYTPYTSTKHQ
jgi:hypothetical protein